MSSIISELEQRYFRWLTVFMDSLILFNNKFAINGIDDLWLTMRNRFLVTSPVLMTKLLRKPINALYCLAGKIFSDLSSWIYRYGKYQYSYSPKISNFNKIFKFESTAQFKIWRSSELFSSYPGSNYWILLVFAELCLFMFIYVKFVWLKPV